MALILSTIPRFFEITTSSPKEFALNFRIPEWAQGARIEVNGKRWPDSPVPGTFAPFPVVGAVAIDVDLQLPRKMRLEPIDSQHPETVALLCGPLVLFAITNNDLQPALTRAQLLACQANRKASCGKRVPQPGSLRMLPYVAIDEEQYSTYLHVT